MVSTWTRLIFTLLITLSVNAAAEATRILIDPGHGGKDQGAVRDDLVESKIALSVAKSLFSLLKKDKRFEVEMTRTDDRWMHLFERAALAKKFRAQLFLSIHVNSSPDASANGTEFYFQNQLPPDQQSMYLAHKENAEDDKDQRSGPKYPFIFLRNDSQEIKTILQDLLDSQRLIASSQFASALKANWTIGPATSKRTIRQAPFYVLSQLPIPSALVELGFLSNSKERIALASKATHLKMAKDLYGGIIKFKESIDKRAGEL